MYDTDRMAIDFVQQFSGQAFTVGQQVSTFTSYFIKKKKLKKNLIFVLLDVVSNARPE